MRVSGYNQHQDLVPTIMELAGIDQSELSWPSPQQFDGSSLMPLVDGAQDLAGERVLHFGSVTWMRKHGWRTPGWKLMVALEPDFHFKPPLELYNLVEDPEENNNLAEQEPGIVADLRRRMEA